VANFREGPGCREGLAAKRLNVLPAERSIIWDPFKSIICNKLIISAVKK